jgi:hypothetical protein
MRALILSDKEYQTALHKDIHERVCGYLAQKGYTARDISVGRGELAHCMGCFGCWIKTPGECVIRDGIAEINRESMGSDVVIYLIPVVFGQFSANMADVINRWLPNMLPFFITRPDGSTMHPPRYESYPAQVMIGYGDSVPDGDAGLFTDIILKHRSNVNAFVYRQGMDMDAQFSQMNLSRTEGLL